jgi:hypothetical protein
LIISRDVLIAGIRLACRQASLGALCNNAIKDHYFERFPSDFMFRLNQKEFSSLRFQIETPKRGGARYCPYVFTGQGVTMFDSIINRLEIAGFTGADPKNEDG